MKLPKKYQHAAARIPINTPTAARWQPWNVQEHNIAKQIPAPPPPLP